MARNIVIRGMAQDISDKQTPCSHTEIQQMLHCALDIIEHNADAELTQHYDHLGSYGLKDFNLILTSTKQGATYKYTATFESMPLFQEYPKNMKLHIDVIPE